MLGPAFVFHVVCRRGAVVVGAQVLKNIFEEYNRNLSMYITDSFSIASPWVVSSSKAKAGVRGFSLKFIKASQGQQSVPFQSSTVVSDWITPAAYLSKHSASNLLSPACSIYVAFALLYSKLSTRSSSKNHLIGKTSTRVAASFLSWSSSLRGGQDDKSWSDCLH